jgi:hypothetical protein
MAIRFRKRIRILPGVWLNVGKSGVSISIGSKGLTVNIGERGTRTTLSVPGTGLSYTHTAVPKRDLAEPARSGRAARFVANLLWVFLIGYLAWAMH